MHAILLRQVVKFLPHAVLKGALVYLLSRYYLFASYFTEAMGIAASSRLRKLHDFQGVRRSGRRIHCGPFVLYCRTVVQSCSPRLGLIASRRVGNAVKRNYAKRIFRELFRHHFAELPLNCELVLIVRSSFDCHSYANLEMRLLNAFRLLRKDSVMKNLILK